jgi:hypothetical protein
MVQFPHASEEAKPARQFGHAMQIIHVFDFFVNGLWKQSISKEMNNDNNHLKLENL